MLVHVLLNLLLIEIVIITGRYGRLGHGDSDDVLKPKLVEGLLGIFVFIFCLFNQS